MIKSETYRRKFLIGYIRITDIIDLWIEVRDDFLRAHCVDLVLEVGYCVEILTTCRCLCDWRNERRFEQPIDVKCKILCHLW